MKLATIALVTILFSQTLFAEEKFDPNTVIFIGSSTMGHWKPRVDTDFAPLSVWDFGENGTDFHYLHETVPGWVKKYPAKRWVIYSGDNDLNNVPTHSPEQVDEDMEKTVKLIREGDPEAEIFLLSIKCRVQKDDQTNCPKVLEANKLMQESAAKFKGVNFVDTYGAMKASGVKMEEFFDADGIHLNKAGYDLWRDTLKPILQRSIDKEKESLPALKKNAESPAEPDAPAHAVTAN
ncbi:MAG: GDSL-type esterase/lipase family protein [Bdellovibrionota bacterium]